MHIGKHVLTDLDVGSIRIPTRTPWGTTTFQERLKQPTSDLAALKRLQNAVMALKTDPDTRTAMTGVLETQVAPNTSLADASCSEEDPRVAESIHQILWSKQSLLAPLNHRAAVISFLVVWKSLVLPGISVIMPILAALVPFFIHRFVYGTPITAWNYVGMLRKAVLQQVSVPAALRPKHAGDSLGNVLESAFLGITVATFISGLWNQVTAALHLRRIAADLEARGKAVVILRGAVSNLLGSLRKARHTGAFGELLEHGETVLANMPAANEDLAAFGHVWNDATPLIALRAWIGRVDVLVTLASMSDICIPRFTSMGSLEIHGVSHPSLTDRRVSNDAVFSPDKSHILLTGPNRGGKSTYCRSVGLAILTAQTWGFAWADRMTLAPFAALETALKTRDELGSLSLFEAEIEFAKSVLGFAKNSVGPIFVMMDEIFHSTNAHDGVAASQIFLHQLYNCRGVSSIISTHYRELVESFMGEGGNTQALCLDAELDEESGRLTYTYRVVPGVSDKSSVLEILHERGLVANMGSAAKLLKRVRPPQSEAAK